MGSLLSPEMNTIFRLALVLLAHATVSVSGDYSNHTCRTYCGNITVDYPFSGRSGCGHTGFRQLLFCVNNVLMFHIDSGSYRVLEIDYAFNILTLSDSGMSTCDKLALGKGNGFVLESWRAPYLKPTSDNVFMLIGCDAESPLFQGFPNKHLPCRNVSGMGCEEFSECPAWDRWPVYGEWPQNGTRSPPDCCAVSFEAIRAINMSRLGCKAYSSAYSLAPLRMAGARGWSYGIHVGYSVPENDYAFCRACVSTGGTCGFEDDKGKQLCLCSGWNSTSNCDSGKSLAMSSKSTLLLEGTITGLLASIAILMG